MGSASIGGDAKCKNLPGMYFEKAIRGYYLNISEGVWSKQVFIARNYEIRFTADSKFQQLLLSLNVARNFQDQAETHTE
jgi:hypothetical protein